MNTITLKGYVARDPEIINTNSGATVIKFGLSVRDPWLKDKQDSSKHHTSFFDIECWPIDKIEGNVQRHVAKIVKGAYLAFDARPVQDRWEKDGQKHSRIKFVTEGFVEALHHPNSNRQAEPQNEEVEEDAVPF